MAVYVDAVCTSCAQVLHDQWSDLLDTTHGFGCTGTWERLWTLTVAPSPGAHPSEKCFVYVSENENKVQYPGRNDVPVPSRLVARGYVKQEITPSQLGSFERRHGVANERRHFDRNGREF
jgi:hypothetical protein